MVWPPEAAYTPIWDEYGYLSSYATIIDQGKNASGQEYITLYFFDDGWTWLNYAGLYPGITEDYDEITLHILP